MNKRKKRLITLTLCLAITLAVFASPLAVPATEGEKTPAQNEMDSNYARCIESNEREGWPQGPQVYAQSAIVLDIDTGAVLYAKNIDEPLYPASITKVMTVLLAIENSSFDERVTFSHEAIWGIERDSSHIGIREGEVLSMEDCLYGMMLESANEVCLAVAEHISGSVKEFVELMNEKAVELGCTNTHFANPNGLPNKKHKTTAHDMALIAQAAFKNESFRQICGTLSWTIGTTNMSGDERHLNQHHKMLKSHEPYYYEYAVGGKTGFTTAALNTLVTFATKGKRNLVCVSLRTNGSQYYYDTAKLLDYGFEGFKNKEVRPRGYPGDDLLFPSLFLHTSCDTGCDTSGQYVTVPKGMKLKDLAAATTVDDGRITCSYSLGDTALGSVSTSIPASLRDISAADSAASRTVQREQAALAEAVQDSSKADAPGSSQTSGAMKISLFDSLQPWQRGVLAVLVVALLFYLVLLITSLRRAWRRHKYKKRRAEAEMKAKAAAEKTGPEREEASAGEPDAAEIPLEESDAAEIFIEESDAAKAPSDEPGAAGTFTDRPETAELSFPGEDKTGEGD